MKVYVKAPELEKTLRKLQGKFQSLYPVMHSISLVMLKAVHTNFEMEGRDEQGNTHVWQPLAKSTVKQRAKYKGQAYAEHPILELTGRLKSSITPSFGKDYAKVGTAKKYGVFHQTGTRKMPARPFLVLPKDEIEKIKNLLLQYLKKSG